jgi:4-amino-4-deoxy-L-arabinose transferase-like glycosyltransferase
MARVLTQTHDRGQPLLYYVYFIPLALLPWLPSLWPGRASPEDRGPMRLLAAWIVLPVVMFTCSGSKMPAYVLPLFPAFALLLGRRLRTGLDRLPYRATQTACLALAAAAVPLALALGVAEARGWESAFAGGDLVWAGGGAVAAAGLLRARARPALFAWAGGSLLLCAYLWALGSATRNETRLGAQTTARGLGRALAREARADDLIFLLNRNPYGLSFYFTGAVRMPADTFASAAAEDRDGSRVGTYADAEEAYLCFDSTQRVYLVLSARLADQLGDFVNRPSIPVYRDGRFVAVRNR